MLFNLIIVLEVYEVGESIIKPVYQQIAIDIANRIVNGEFILGSKIYGRSTLAGQYGVSPETIRRAVKFLEDMEIVTVKAGSGIIVKSRDEALKFVERFKNIDSMLSLKKRIWNIIKEKNKLDEEVKSCINKFIDYSEHVRKSTPFAPIEVVVPKNSHLVGKTIGESNFWQNTSATIIAIKKDDKIVLSPGPYQDFIVGDTLVMIGDEEAYQRAFKYLNE
jgi:K+/H+ antiporter YhaU regulatory subunit KhtT